MKTEAKRTLPRNEAKAIGPYSFSWRERVRKSSWSPQLSVCLFGFLVHGGNEKERDLKEIYGVSQGYYCPNAKVFMSSTVTELLSVSAAFIFWKREGTVGDQKFFNFVFVNALVFCVIYRRGAAVSGVGEGYEGKFINCFGILIRLS